MTSHAGAAVLLLHDGAARDAFGLAAEEHLTRAGFVVLAPELSAAARADRAALRELDRALDSLAQRPDVDRERVAAVGFERGGTLAFLLGCTRRLAAVVNVEGPVLYPALTAEYPTQPLELALNLEGAFLGAFSGRSGVVGAEEIGLLRGLLSSAARRFDIVVDPEARPGFLDPRRPQFDAARADELWRQVLAFLCATLAEDAQ